MNRLGDDLDQPGALQSLQRLADGCARDAQALGELLIAEALAGLEPAVEDRLAEECVHLVAEHGAARLEGRERDGHEC